MNSDTKTTTQTKPAAKAGLAAGHAPHGQAKPPTLHLERTFDATPERLWQYFVDPKLYAKWIYPGSTDVEMHAFEPRVGGKVSFSMLLDEAQGGQDMLNEGVFHVLDKPRRIESGSPDKSFLIVVEFVPKGTSQTLLKVTIDGVPAAYQEGAKQGWASCFQKLQVQLDAPNVSAGARGTVKDRYVELTRWFNAPPAKVYQAWTDPAILPKFFWPVGTGKVVKLDLKVGGVLEMGHTTMPDWKATWRFKEIVPGRKLVIVDVWPDGSGAEATGTMEFLPENGGTRMKVRHGPFPTEGPYQPEGAKSGFAMVADRLAETVETANAGEGFRLVRHFNAPPEKVYAMWTDKENLAKWWGASAKDMGYAFRVDQLDVKAGGKYDIVMSNKEHGELHNHGTYVEVVPNSRLVQQWQFDIFLGPGEKPYPIVIRITFEPEPTWDGKTGTKMTFIQGPMAKADFTEGSRQGVISNLAKLEQALA